MVAVYVAARFSARERLLKQVVEPLERAGHTVTSRWMREPEGSNVLNQETLTDNPYIGEKAAMECQEDIIGADAVAIFTHEASSTGGYHTELGIALGLDKRVDVIGPLPNVFYTLPHIIRHEGIEAFLRDCNYGA